MDTNIFDSPLSYLKSIANTLHIPKIHQKNFAGKSMAFVFFTKFCDVKCSHCFFRPDNEYFDLPREQHEFSDTCFEQFLSFINSSHNGYLAILEGGEPFKKFEYIKQTVQKAKTDFIVLVTSGVWASDYETAKTMIFELYDAFQKRNTPTKVVLRVSIDTWHFMKIPKNCIYTIIDVFHEFFTIDSNFELQLHTIVGDTSIEELFTHYPDCHFSQQEKYVSENGSTFKIGYSHYNIEFPDRYILPVGVAPLFHSNLKVNLTSLSKEKKQLLRMFEKDIQYNCYGNPSLVYNSNNQWGLNFLINYNGNISTWQNEQPYQLNNLYTDSYSDILSHTIENIISYSFLDKGYFYRTKVIKEVNPLAVLRSEAMHIRDYAGFSLLEENHSTLYYAIRILQDYLKEKVITLDDLLPLPIELIRCILESKRILKKQYKESNYSIIQQYMEKESFMEEEWKDLFNLIHLGHYQVSSEQLYQGVCYYNQHAHHQIRHIEEILENSKEHYNRLMERFTFMKLEAKEICSSQTTE